MCAWTGVILQVVRGMFPSVLLVYSKSHPVLMPGFSVIEAHS